MFKLKSYLPFIGNLVIINTTLLIFYLLYTNFTELHIAIISGICIVFSHGASHFYANAIFKYISHFNIQKSQNSISEVQRQTQDLTLEDVRLFLLAHRKSFIYANIFLIPLAVVIYISLVYGTDMIGQAGETASQMGTQNPDREFNELELTSIFLPTIINAYKYMVCSFVATHVLAAYFATKRMFGNKKINNQFYLCR